MNKLEKESERIREKERKAQRTERNEGMKEFV
jgi:hypothetical protein